ncbi:MAG TPA: hypothetical protein VF614_03115 [Chthoniobacteraceae bacterium]|jgi:hypothetical protein
MKLPLLALLAASLLPLQSSFAENLIFLGTETSRQISRDFTGKVPSRIFVVLDRTNARLGGVLFFGAGSDKSYIILTARDAVAAVVRNRARPGETITAFGHAETTAFDPAVVLTASLFKGVNSSVDIGGTGGVARVPKVISGTGFLLDTGDDELVPLLENLKTLARLELTFTRASNNANGGAGEPLDDAIDRIVTALEEQGYEPFSTASASSAQ